MSAASDRQKRICLDHLRSARERREVYVGPWLPEPTLDAAALSTGAAREFGNDLSVALMLTLERLTALERAAFILHDVFEMEFTQIAEALDRTPAACRQLAARARARVRAERPRFRPSPEAASRLAKAFAAAVRAGDPRELAKLLAADATFRSDGGGKHPAARRVVVGRERVARLVAGLARKAGWSNGSLTPATINGQPGYVLRRGDGRLATIAPDFDGQGALTAIYVMVDAEKLSAIRAQMGRRDN